MRRPTHTAGGVAAGLGVSAAAGLGPDGALAFTAGAVATANLPDIDRKWNEGPQHRSYPHSLAYGGGAVLLFSLVAYALLVSFLPVRGLSSSAMFGTMLAGTPLAGAFGASSLALAAPGTAVGYLTHLALDCTTKTGVWLAAPRGRRFGIPEKYAYNMTGSKAPDLLVRFVLVMACVGLALVVFAPALAAGASVAATPAGATAALGVYAAGSGRGAGGGGGPGVG